jgi:hypothetical protein
MGAEKTCPKCPNSTQMRKIERRGFIFSVLPNEKISGPDEAKEGFPVNLYECPQCRLVELYAQ